jgi:hypothetical protein
MGVCCGRNINEPISIFIKKAREKKINLGIEEMFKEAVLIAQEYKSDKLEIGEIVEILDNNFSFTDNFHQFGISFMYAFHVKDDKGETFRCNVIISKTDPSKYDCRIYKYNEDTKANSYLIKSPNKPLEANTVSPKRLVSYSLPVSYKLAKTDLNKANQDNKFSSTPNKSQSPFNSKSPKQLANISQPSSPTRVTSSRYSYSPNNQKPVTKTFEISLNSVNPFKTIKEEETKNGIKPRNSMSSNNTLNPYKQFRDNASKKNIDYGKEFYFTKALQLIEKQGKQIYEIETTNFHYSDKALTVFGKCHRYQFIIIDTLNVRYSCDVTVAVNGRDNIVKIIPYMSPLNYKRASMDSASYVSPEKRKSK